jgi:hypothetical protein
MSLTRTVTFACALAAIAACSKTAKPAQDPVRADLTVFCSAEVTAKATGLPELGAYLEPKLSSPELQKVFSELKSTGALEVFKSQMTELLAKHHVDACPTLDQLFAKRPATP